MYKYDRGFSLYPLQHVNINFKNLDIIKGKIVNLIQRIINNINLESC